MAFMQTTLYTPETVSSGIVYGDYKHRFLALEGTLTLVIAHADGYLPLKLQDVPRLSLLFPEVAQPESEEIILPAEVRRPTQPIAAVPAPVEVTANGLDTPKLLTEIQDAIARGDNEAIATFYRTLSRANGMIEITDQNAVMLPQAALDEEAQAEKLLRRRV